LRVKNLGPIKDATIQFGDLTVLVGPQATGKSLLLQMAKFCLDGEYVARDIDANGFSVNDQSQVLEQYLGEGMGQAWTKTTTVAWDGKVLEPASLTRKKAWDTEYLRPSEQVFYIPAQRSLALADGWPPLFHQFQVPPPYVVRSYSQTLNVLLSRASSEPGKILFPIARQIQGSIRAHIDRAIFHGGKLYIDQSGQRRQLKLDYGQAKPAFPSWTAGQREFIPLLLDLYFLLPSTGRHNRPVGYRWVVLEEPEMGLHPNAILSVMLLVLDLLRRDYRVAISTHSPVVLDIVWALGRLQRWKKQVNASEVLKLFGEFPVNKGTQPLAEVALRADYRVYYLDSFEGAGVVSRDISSLDPGAQEEWLAGWGGLTGVSSNISNVVGRIAAKMDTEEDA
jgi:hypothetical protein